MADATILDGAACRASPARAGRSAGIVRVLLVATLSLPLGAAEPEPSLDLYLDQVAFEELGISPDGGELAFVTRRSAKEGWRWDVWWMDLEAPGAEPRRLTDGGVAYGLGWRPRGNALSFVRLADGGEEVVLSEGGAPPRAVSGLPGPLLAHEWLPDGDLVVATPGEPEEDPAVTGHPAAEYVRRRSPPRSSASILHRVRVEPGGRGIVAAEVLGSVPGTVAMLRADPAGRRLALVDLPEASAADPYLGTELAVVSLQGGLAHRRLTTNGMREGFGFQQPALEWSSDGAALTFWAWGREAPGRGPFGQWRLYRVTLDGGEPERLAAGFEGSFEGLALLPDGTLLTTAYRSTHKNLYRLDPAAPEPEDVTGLAGRVSLFAASAGGRRIALALEDGLRFEEIHVAEGLDGLGASRRVTSFHAALQALPLPEVETVRWENGEGGVVEGVLHWPPGRRGDRDLPLVVDLHGGPWLARTETVGLAAPSASYPALLAWRGYLVLAPNFRGSAGRGDPFLQAVRDHPCSRPAVDVETGVASLVERGWVDPERIAVMGHSFGGTLVNCLLTRSDRFAAAMTDAGVWSFASAFGGPRLPFDWGFLFSSPTPWGDPETYWRESPIGGGGAIHTPTLVTFGEDATTPPVGQAFELFRALEVAAIPAELLLFPGESVWIERRSHQRAKLAAELAWLERWIGPGVGSAAETVEP